MELEHEKMTQQEAVEKLRVKVNGKNWCATRLAIVRLKREKAEHWVHMIIHDPDNPKNSLEFLALRPAMIECWMALQLGEKKIDQLEVQIDHAPDTVLDVSEGNLGGESWIFVVLLNKDVTISIERQSMINAYYALCTNVEDFLEAGAEAVKGFMKLL